MPGWYAVNDKVLDADVIINVPKMKTHNLMINTLAMKNLVGLTLRNTYDEEASDCMPRIAHCITGSTGNDFYFNNDIFWRAVSDMNKVVLYADKQGNLQTTQQRKYLNVIDGIQAMEKSENYGYGGDGLPYDRHVVLASVDPVAVDAVASRVMGYDFNYVPVVGNAASDILHPIGINNPGKIAILGEEIDSRLNHVFVFNDAWKGYAGSLAVTDFVPPTINTVTRQGNTVTANISGGSTAYIIYQIDDTDSILEMDKDLDTYSAVLPSTVSQCLIRAQDEYFNTTSTIPLPSPTTTTVSSSNNPQSSPVGDLHRYGQPSAATGTVQFSIDGTAFGSPVTLSGGNATSSATSSISVGSHTISAAYAATLTTVIALAPFPASKR